MVRLARPPADVLQALIERVQASPDLDTLTCAHLTATFLAPPGSFVSIGPINRDVRVCVGRGAFTGGDIVWTDWPAWNLRWAAGTLDAAFGLVERAMPGVSFLYGRGRTRAAEPPYACHLLFGSAEVLGEAEADDGPAAVVLALLDALLKQADGAAVHKSNTRLHA